MPEQLTTLREVHDDGSQLHESVAGVAVMTLSEELIHCIGTAVEKLDQNEGSRTLSTGMGLWVPGLRVLNRLPTPGYREREDPNFGLHPIIDAFGKFIFANSDEVLRGLRPSYIRILAIGPDADRLYSWHCDPEVISVNDHIVSETPPNVGRIVVGVDGRLRENSAANIQFVDGSFVVKDAVAERDDCMTKDWEDQYKGYPEGATLVTRESGSVMDIGDKDFAPDPAKIKQYGDFILTDLGCTSLHAAIPSADSIRFSLQCFYNGFEELSTERQV
jgi:hypothetical protein